MDVYLGYLYDVKVLKKTLIEELVTTVWNTGDCILDPQAVSEYILSHSREHGLSSTACFFGRSPPMSASGSNNSSKFVLTSSTLRLLESLCQSVHADEPLLLVGETGTGKTTCVQELAKLLGKKLHVFNLNQNTDASELMGGFKPVDAKFLLKPLYEQFLFVFKREMKKDNQKFLDLVQHTYETGKIKDFLQCIDHGLEALSKKKTLD